MESFLTVVHIVVSVLLVLVVLIQSGKGAEISASLGGSSQTIFGSSGGANFFTRFTAAMAAIFMATSIGLTVIKTKDRESLFDTAPVSAPAKAPQDATAPAREANPVRKEAQKPEKK